MPPFEFLGPYRIGEPLGRGGMGTVYRAIHEKTKQPVAVKLISAQVADETRFRDRFEAESETLQRLRHEGIVRVIGFGEEEDHLFYSMELVEGESLQTRIKREKKIDWMATIDIAIEICAALKHAHDIGVIHRDLKPANLILTQNNHVKLVDFGIAKLFGNDQHTMVGSVLGTADYMAPEQITSMGITVRTDLYSLGSLIYAMLAGRPPFSGKNTTEVIKSLERTRPVPLDMIDPHLPESLVDLVHQLLEKDPADRPPTALAVMNRLKAMRAGLQRAQTLVGKESPTQVGPGGKPSKGETPSRESLSSSDTSPTGFKSGSDLPTNLINEPTQIRQSSRGLTDVSKASIARPGEHVSGSPTRATEVSDTRKSKTLPPGGKGKEAKRKKTHFQTVSDGDAAAGIFSPSSESKSVWSHAFAIIGMLVVLGFGAALFMRAMRPPNADQLYASATDDEDRGARKAFLKQFPDDVRAPEVLDLLMVDRLQGAINRLTAQAKLGVAPLIAAEEGFVGAMEGRQQTPKESSERLQYWLNAFDIDSNRADPELKQLIELAEYERARLARMDPTGVLDSRVTDLMQQIDVARRLDDRDEGRRRLQGIINTFGDQSWAKPAVERARQLISE